MNPFSAQDRVVVLAARFLIAALVCMLLYWGRAVLIPLTLATLIAFVLHPVVVRLQRWRFPKMVAVGVALLLGTGLIVSACWYIAVQVASFTGELPLYQRNISEKISQAQSAMRGGVLERMEKLFEKVARDAREDQAEQGVAPPPEPEPVPVTLRPSSKWVDLTLVESALPFLDPLVTGGLIFVLVALMLLRWEDLRSRVVSLMNQNVTKTTRAIDDAGKRIAKYLAMQFIVNMSFGIAVGLGLRLLGVPYAGLWGLCAALFRYVPYAGPMAAAALPLMVSLVTSSGWTQVAGVAILFLSLELLSNNVIEPWLYGWRIGLSELGVIIAAVAWTFLWGTAGLVLAMPMTVCLVVLGEHVPSLSLFSRLLGDKSALPRHLRLYQRLLARDKLEASDLARDHAREHGFEKAGDEVIAPALAHAREEELAGSLSEDEVSGMAESMAFIIDRAEETSADRDDDEESQPASTNHLLPERVVVWPLCALSESLVPLLQHLCDDLPCDWHTVSESALSSEVVGKMRAGGELPSAVIFLSLSTEDLPRVRSLCKKVRHVCPDLHILVACWPEEPGSVDMEDALKTVGVAATSWAPTETRSDLAPHILDRARAASSPPPARSSSDEISPHAALTPA